MSTEGDAQAKTATVEEVTAQGLIVRELKSSGASKEEITAAVEKLVALKKAAGISGGGRAKKSKKKPAAAAAKKEEKGGNQKSSLLGVEADRMENFSEWYVQTLARAELIEYTDISGCFVIRPNSFYIWEKVTEFFDAEIKKLGVRNSYFPIFVSEKALNSEADFVEGFAPEVAWVTKAGSSDLAEPIAVRPTSETIMYPMFAKWIRSHRDLPLKLNQWCNVVRWEFKHAVPFLRAREFLWQEGHSAFATKEQADEEVMQILDLYRRVYEDILAVPVIPGKKTNKEKFAGGLYTTTVEAFIEPNGRAIQAATSHSLGQHFSTKNAFNIEFENESGEKANVWQNSWGLSTRSIGVMIMTHGDDKGLVLPPKVASIQVIVIPILQKQGSDVLIAKAKEIVDSLVASGVRAEGDYRQNYKPGWKYNHYETRGVPIRLEIGAKDMAKSAVVLCRRDTGKKTFDVKWEGLSETISTMLTDIQDNLFTVAKKKYDDHLKSADNYKDFLDLVNQKNIVSVPFCCTTECENAVKKKSGEDSQALAGDQQFELTGSAKSLCIPFNQPELPEGKKCFACEKAATAFCNFGRSY